MAAVVAVAGCGKPAGPKPAPANPVVFDPAAGSGPWFLCDGLNAPTVIEASRPKTSPEVTVVIRDKEGLRPPVIEAYTVGAPTTAAGSVVRSLSRAGAEVGYVKIADPATMSDPGGATTPPVTEVKIGDAVLSCRWLAHTRLYGLTTRNTVLITDDKGELVYRVFEFKDAKTAEPIQIDAVQRSTKPTLEVRTGEPRGDTDFMFTNGTSRYSVGEGGITAIENDRVVSGEPFVTAQQGPPR